MFSHVGPGSGGCQTTSFPKSQCQSPKGLSSSVYGGFGRDLDQAKRSQLRQKRLQQSASANNMSVIVSGDGQAYRIENGALP